MAMNYGSAATVGYDGYDHVYLDEALTFGYDNF